MKAVSVIAIAAAIIGGIALATPRTTTAQAPSNAIPAGCTSKVTLSAARQYGEVVSTISGSRQTAGAVAAWQEAQGRRNDVVFVSDLRSLPSSTLVDVCQYSGAFYTPLPPAGPGQQARPLHNVLRLLVFDSGDVVLDSAGYAATMALDLP